MIIASVVREVELWISVFSFIVIGILMVIVIGILMASTSVEFRTFDRLFR